MNDLTCAGSRHPDRGRFRSFLLAAARNFVCNEFDRQSAFMRGGHVVLRSLNYEFGERQLSRELSGNESAETIFERCWAIAMLDRVLKQLQDEYAAADIPEVQLLLSSVSV